MKTDESNSSNRKPALLDLLLNKQDENKMNLDDIWEEVETFMFAGKNDPNRRT
jgi:hypothetical protein